MNVVMLLVNAAVMCEVQVPASVCVCVCVWEGRFRSGSTWLPLWVPGVPEHPLTVSETRVVTQDTHSHSYNCINAQQQGRKRALLTSNLLIWRVTGPQTLKYADKNIQHLYASSPLCQKWIEWQQPNKYPFHESFCISRSKCLVSGNTFLGKSTENRVFFYISSSNSSLFWINRRANCLHFLFTVFHLLYYV